MKKPISMPVRYGLLAAGALVLGACSSPDAICGTDRDCFSGEVCLSTKVCGPPESAERDAATQQNESDSSLPVSDRDATSAAADGGLTDDLGTNEDMGGTSAPDADSELDAMGSGGACVVDPFTYTCADDAMEPNNTWFDGEFLTVLGCNPQWQPYSETFTARTCQNDGSDFYYVNFLGCDDSTWVLEFQLEMSSDCDTALATLEPFSFKCDEPGVQCLEADGKPTVRMLIDETFQTVQTFYVQVHNGGRNDVTFDYKLHVTARR